VPAQKTTDAEILSRLEAGQTVEAIWRETKANKDRIRRLRNSQGEIHPSNVVPRNMLKPMVEDHVDPKMAPRIWDPKLSFTDADYQTIQWYCRKIKQSGGKTDTIGINKMVEFIRRLI